MVYIYILVKLDLLTANMIDCIFSSINLISCGLYMHSQYIHLILNSAMNKFITHILIEKLHTNGFQTLADKLHFI